MTTVRLLRFKIGVKYVQKDSMAGRVQVPRWGLLRDLRDSLLPVAVPHSNAGLWHWLRPDTRARRIPFHCQYRPVLHVLLPRFHSKVERPFDQLTDWCQRRRRASQGTSPWVVLHKVMLAGEGCFVTR